MTKAALTKAIKTLKANDFLVVPGTGDSARITAKQDAFYVNYLEYRIEFESGRDTEISESPESAVVIISRTAGLTAA